MNVNEIETATKDVGLIKLSPYSHSLCSVNDCVGFTETVIMFKKIEEHKRSVYVGVPPDEDSGEYSHYENYPEDYVEIKNSMFSKMWFSMYILRSIAPANPKPYVCNTNHRCRPVSGTNLYKADLKAINTHKVNDVAGRNIRHVMSDGHLDRMILDGSCVANTICLGDSIYDIHNKLISEGVGAGYEKMIEIFHDTIEAFYRTSFSGTGDYNNKRLYGGDKINFSNIDVIARNLNVTVIKNGLIDIT